MKNKSGFTLVEMAIVIAVIGILIAVGTVSFVAIQRDARDDKRSADTLLIAEALEKYYEKNGEYPSCAMMKASPTTIANTTLRGVSTNIFKAPQAASGVTSSIVCTNPTSTSGDVYAYLGDDGTDCATGNFCAGWIIRYQKENGEVAEIQSRHGSDVAGHEH